MKEGTGFFYLNAADQSLGFELPDLKLGKDGALNLEQSGQNFAQRGVFRVGPFQLGAIKASWFRLRPTADEMADGTHLQLFACANDPGNAPPFPPCDQNPCAAPAW